MSNHYIENRPWGSYEILTEFSVDEPGYQGVCVKKLIIKPGQKPSYQSHKHRNEYWIIVQGEGAVVLNNKEIAVKVGSFVEVKIGDKHRIINTSKNQDLVFIEIQTGHYDENDIERFEDDYGGTRKPTAHPGKYAN